MTKVNSFIAQFVAMAKGDDVTVTGAKAWRQAESNLKVQISSMECSVGLEDAIEEAKEVLSIVRVNGGRSFTASESKSYTDRLLEAKNNVTKVEKALELHKITLAFYQDELETLRKMVEVSPIK